MKLGTRLHLAGHSLSDTVMIVEELGVDRCCRAVHNWVQKVDLQQINNINSDHVAVDETVIQINNEQYWLYAAVYPSTNCLLHARLFPTRTTAVSSEIIANPRKKSQVDHSIVLVYGVPWLQAACHRLGL